MGMLLGSEAEDTLSSPCTSGPLAMAAAQGSNLGAASNPALLSPCSPQRQGAGNVAVAQRSPCPEVEGESKSAQSSGLEARIHGAGSGEGEGGKQRPSIQEDDEKARLAGFLRWPGASLLGCLHRLVREERLGLAEHWNCNGCVFFNVCVCVVVMVGVVSMTCLHVLGWRGGLLDPPLRPTQNPNTSSVSIRCGHEQRAVKQLSICGLPPVLTMHAKRFGHPGNNRAAARKLDTYLSFPLHGLDMRPFLTPTVLRTR
jgi:hypothetical protein